MTTKTCDRCGEPICASLVAAGWPVEVQAEWSSEWDESESICPSCYGDEAFCPVGHVLHGQIDDDTHALPEEGAECEEEVARG